MRARLWLILWLLGILFPMAFLEGIWPAFGHLFNAVFAPGWMFAIKHIFRYGAGNLADILDQTTFHPICIDHPEAGFTGRLFPRRPANPDSRTMAGMVRRDL
jgi:hypothetical protein